MQLFGGREPFADKLDALFTAEPGVSNENVADMTGFIGQYVHGNEPSHHIAYLYVWAGQGYKTQERLRELLLTHYRNDFDGLDGNEDCGQMLAWYVMSALGLYAVDPVSARTFCRLRCLTARPCGWAEARAGYRDGAHKPGR